MTTRGNAYAGRVVADYIIQMVEENGFDLAMRGLAEPEIIRVFELLPSGRNPVDVLIAGWSEAHGPRHMHFSNIPVTGGMATEPMPVLTLTHPGAFWAAGPTLGDFDLSLLRAVQLGETVEDYAASVGMHVMEHLRRTPTFPGATNKFEGEAFIVGGQVDLTAVTAAGVSTRTIHRWDDRIGEKIDPFADRRAVVQLSAGLNRQQRRAGERAERKRLRA